MGHEVKKLPTWTREQVAALRASGGKLTPMYLYEPQHAPKGTLFVMFNGSPWRVRPAR
jgi:hypothetical protein